MYREILVRQFLLFCQPRLAKPIQTAIPLLHPPVIGGHTEDFARQQARTTLPNKPDEIRQIAKVLECWLRAEPVDVMNTP